MVICLVFVLCVRSNVQRECVRVAGGLNSRGEWEGGRNEEEIRFETEEGR